MDESVHRHMGSDAARVHVRVVPLRGAARRAASVAARSCDLEEGVEDAPTDTSSPDKVMHGIAVKGDPRRLATVSGRSEPLEV